MTPDLRQLQALTAIADHGALGPAADALGCSPSALSMQLSALQQRLGRPLVRRTGRGLALTPEGERLLPAARDTLAALQRLTRLAREGGDAGEAADEPGHPAPVELTIGTVLDPDALRLGEFLRAVRAAPRHGAAPILPELRHGISGWVLREAREGRLDLGFCLGEPDPARLRVRRLAPVRYVVIGPRGWQARLQGRDWAALAGLPWIATPPASVHHQLLAPVFRRLGRRMHTVARVDQEASMVDLVRAGFGLSLAREAVALREADQHGLAVSRAHAIETALWLVAPRTPADAARAEAVDQLFEVAAAVWQGGERLSPSA